MTIIFAVLALLSYNSDAGTLTVIPIAGIVIGVVMCIMAAIEQSKKSARVEEQKNFSDKLVYNLMLYFNNQQKTITIGSSTTSNVTQEVVNDFVKTEVVDADSFIAVLDANQRKVLRVSGNAGKINRKTFSIAGDYEEKCGKRLLSSNPTLRAYNDYAFITDDVNQYVFILTPSKSYFLLYSDLVSVSYEENGNDVYNKSLGGAVVGGLLFGGVGAIVGGSTAKAKQNKEVSKMVIKILKKDTANPNIRLVIYSGVILKTKNTADNMRYEELMKEVTGIKDIFSVILDIADNQKKFSKDEESVPSPVSVADELTKLANLKAQGILSEEEFEKQKAKFIYGVLEKQFRGYYDKAKKMEGITGENLLILLERRIDNVVFRLGLANTRRQARQIVRHGHIAVNGKRLDIPSALVRVGDVVTVMENSRAKEYFKGMDETLATKAVPAWLVLDAANVSGKVDRFPTREEIDVPIEEHFIVELYSK